MTKGNVPPTKGGCWYCWHQDADLEFSMEFDTYVHRRCVEERLKTHSDDDEALFIGAELGVSGAQEALTALIERERVMTEFQAKEMEGVPDAPTR